MDNKRIDMYERRFKDHVAIVKQLDEETKVLTFKRPDSIMWSTEFIFRKNLIFVSGDTGCAVFSTTFEPTWNYDWENTSPECFAEKCQAFFQEKYVLDQEKAEKDITDHIISTLNYYDYDEYEANKLAKEVITLAKQYSEWISVEDKDIFTKKDNESVLKQSFLILSAIYTSNTINDWVLKIQQNNDFSDCMNDFYDNELYDIGRMLHSQFEMWIFELRKAKEQLQNKNTL